MPSYCGGFGTLRPSCAANPVAVIAAVNSFLSRAATSEPGAIALIALFT